MVHSGNVGAAEGADDGADDVEGANVGAADDDGADDVDGATEDEGANEGAAENNGISRRCPDWCSSTIINSSQIFVFLSLPSTLNDFAPYLHPFESNPASR